MRITHQGNIGIGSYGTPSTRLSFGPFTAGDVSMKLAVADNSINRYGIGYHEEGTGKLFSFFLSDPTYGRFAFFDSYDVNHVRGNEFVTFNAANRSVGINNSAPTSRLHVVGNPSISGGDYSLAIPSGGSYYFINVGRNPASSSSMGITSSYYNGSAFSNVPLILNGPASDGINYFGGGNVGIGNFIAQ